MCKKYGHRGLLYIALEAGALAHQLCEVMRNNNIQSVQIGGYYDDLMIQNVSPKEKDRLIPLLLIAFGYEQET